MGIYIRGSGHSHRWINKQNIGYPMNRNENHEILMPRERMCCFEKPRFHNVLSRSLYLGNYMDIFCSSLEP